MISGYRRDFSVRSAVVIYACVLYLSAPLSGVQAASAHARKLICWDWSIGRPCSKVSSKEQSSTSQSDAAGLDAPRSIVSALTPFSPTTPNASVFSCASTEVLGLWRERAKEHAEMSALLSQVPETETDASPAGQQRSATERKPGRSTTHAQESPPARETPRTV